MKLLPPKVVVERDATALAKTVFFSKLQFLMYPCTKPAAKQSPAPVVSLTSTLKPSNE